MRVGINSPVSSISAFSTDLKRIQTLHSLFRDFGADKTFYNPLVRRQSSSLSPSSLSHPRLPAAWVSSAGGGGGTSAPLNARSLRCCPSGRVPKMCSPPRLRASCRTRLLSLVNVFTLVFITILRPTVSADLLCLPQMLHYPGDANQSMKMNSYTVVSRA